MNQEAKLKMIQNTWLRFNSNVGALYALFENLTANADETDKFQIQQIANELVFIFKGSSELAEKDIKKFIPSVDDLDVYPDFRKNESVKEIIFGLKDQKIRNAMLEWEAKKPYRAERFKRLFSSVFNNPPMNGVLIRRSMLVSLVTFLEIFLEDTYNSYHLALDETKESAQKATDKLTKGGWQQRLGNLRAIGLDISIISKYSNEIIEVAQRRNLLVHNDGVVDDNYKAKISNRYEIGDHLLVSTRYFQRAIDIFHVFGFVLFYSQFGRCEENKQSLYNKLDEFILDSLGRKRYYLVLEISENSESLNLSEDKQLIVLANRAIAYRELGKAEEVDRIVSHLINAEHNWQIGIAISMLTNDIPSLKRQIKDMPDVPNIVRISTWPLFDPVKNEPWFKIAFAKKIKVQLPRKTGKHGRK